MPIVSFIRSESINPLAFPRGPQPSITCPVGAINIPSGSTTSSRQTLINANPGATFCIQAGIHTANGNNIPTSNSTFIGQYGSFIDGTGWSSSSDQDAVFQAHNTTIVNVTLRNLTMRNLPQRGIQCFPWDQNTGWIIEYCEIGNCGDGAVPGNNAIIRNNYIHHCYRVGHPSGLTGATLIAGGAFPNTLNNILVQQNELAYFGASQKFLDATNMFWRENYIHNSDGPGIWNDSVGDNSIFEDNIISWCERGIMWEMSRFGTIRNNIISYCSDQGIFCSTSRNSNIYNNQILNNFRGIVYFIDCSNTDANHIPPWGWSPDLSNNNTYDNIIRVPTTVGSLANFFTYSGGGCPGAQPTPYINNTMNNNFNTNTYYVPDLAGFYWLNGGGLLNFSQWQALPRDAGSTIGLL